MTKGTKIIKAFYPVEKLNSEEALKCLVYFLFCAQVIYIYNFFYILLFNFYFCHKFVLKDGLISQTNQFSKN